MEYMCPSCGELLTYRSDFRCWWCADCKWFARQKNCLNSCVTIEDTDEVNNG